MVNPDEITDYNRTTRELEEFMVFAICVAGKNAHTTATILNVLFENAEYWRDYPFEYFAKSGSKFLKSNGIGCYNMRYKSIYTVWRNLRNNPGFLKTCTVDDLEEIHGIGPKTARFFIMHSRPNQRLAALDTHILKELKANGIKVPKSTPAAGKKYAELEQEFIKLADAACKSVADYDLEVWKKHRKKAFWPVSP